MVLGATAEALPMRPTLLIDDKRVEDVARRAAAVARCRKATAARRVRLAAAKALTDPAARAKAKRRLPPRADVPPPRGTDATMPRRHRSATLTVPEGPPSSAAGAGAEAGNAVLLLPPSTSRLELRHAAFTAPGSKPCTAVLVALRRSDGWQSAVEHPGRCRPQDLLVLARCRVVGGAVAQCPLSTVVAGGGHPFELCLLGPAGLRCDLHMAGVGDAAVSDQLYYGPHWRLRSVARLQPLPEAVASAVPPTPVASVASMSVPATPLALPTGAAVPVAAVAPHAADAAADDDDDEPPVLEYVAVLGQDDES